MAGGVNFRPAPGLLEDEDEGPSKWAQTWDIVSPYFTGPANAVMGLMDADLNTLLYDTGPAARQAVENSFNVAGTVTGGSSVASKPANSLNMGIRAYHGSPHDFDTFSLDKIGTGEGAQAYGHGLYQAQQSGIGRGYRDSIMWAQGIDPEMKIGEVPIMDFYSSMDQSLARMPAKQASEGYDQLALLEDLADGGDVLYIREKAAEGAYSPQAVEWFEKTIAPKFNRKGVLYETEINADPDAFLDWDKPLSEQPEAVRRIAGWTPEADAQYRSARRDDTDALAAALEGDGNYAPTKMPRPLGTIPMDATGDSLYRALVEKQHLAANPPVPFKASEAAISKKLAKAGIPGIKYLDAGSRPPTYGPYVQDLLQQFGSKEKALEVARQRLASASDVRSQVKAQEAVDALSIPETRNYVVFDDKLISIVRKYGIAGASAMLGYNILEGIDPAQAEELRQLEAAPPGLLDGGNQ
jgi:hypothetical protein